jgi:carbonic anhydrase/acetyltransferase-like protein (isoleucine patch superfamily)
MDKAVVQKYGFVAAGSVVSPGKIVESKQLWAGVPARYVRDLTEEDIVMIKDSATHYMKLAEHYIKRN